MMSWTSNKLLKVVLSTAFCIFVVSSFAFASDETTSNGEAALQETKETVEAPVRISGTANPLPFNPDAPYVVNGFPSDTPPAPIDMIERNNDRGNGYDELDTWMTIDFDDVVGAPHLFMNTVRLTTEYSWMGATFSGPGGNDGGALLDEAGNFGVTNYTSPNFLAFNNNSAMSDGGIPQGPETITFSPNVSQVDLYAGHASGGTIYLDAYDVGGNWLTWDWVTSSSALQLMSVSAPNIAYVVLSYTGSVLVVDDLMYNTAAADILLLHSTTVTNSVQLALDNLGASYDIVNTVDWDNQNLTDYNTVILAMDGGAPDANDIQAAISYAENGGKLVLIGGTNLPTFYAEISDLVQHTGVTGWQTSANPQHNNTNTDHPLTTALASTYNYSNNSASYYMLRVDDILCHVAAENGDGWPSLYNKDVGSGQFFHYTSSAQSFYWTNPVDHGHLEQVIDNILNYNAPLYVTSTPWVYPINIPSAGGSFQRSDFVQNVSGAAYTFDAWIQLVLPSGTVYGPLVMYPNLTLLNFDFIAVNPIQNVPGFAPMGTYMYVGRCGDYPYSVGEFHFDFTKLGPGPAAIELEGVEGFELIGWVDRDVASGDAGSEFTANELPSEYVMETAYPNPFNPTTSVTLRLPEASDLKVSVYNVNGQVVSQLSNNRYTAGSHTLTFDASNLSSGIYFIQALVPGKMNEMQKIMLVK